MQQLLIDTAFAARQSFPGKPLRVWYVMLSPTSWKTIIIDTASKVKLIEGPIKLTPKASLLALKRQLETVSKIVKV